jgi:hypothetical protein
MIILKKKYGKAFIVFIWFDIEKVRGSRDHFGKPSGSTVRGITD